jgi:putative toxin-antitoxin system antitoxin component (TIGR02293 family)
MARITATTGRAKAPATSPAASVKQPLVAPVARGSAAGRGARKAPPAPAVQRTKSITYARAKGVSAFVSRVAAATPMELVELERRGIDGMFLKDLSRHMQIPAVRIFDIVGVPKATAEKKAAAKEPMAGAGGQAVLGLARLLAIAKGIVDNSTAPEAKDFDTARWLGQWIERPQPALGGRKPADLIGTPTGLQMVARVLGAIESGAYQ